MRYACPDIATKVIPSFSCTCDILDPFYCVAANREVPALQPSLGGVVEAYMVLCIYGTGIDD